MQDVDGYLHSENVYFVADKLAVPVNEDDIYHNLRLHYRLYDVDFWPRFLYIPSLIVCLLVLFTQGNLFIYSLSRLLAYPVHYNEDVLRVIVVAAITALIGYSLYVLVRIILSFSPYMRKKIKSDFQNLIQEGQIIRAVTIVDIQSKGYLTHTVTYNFVKDGNLLNGEYQTRTLFKKDIRSANVLYYNNKLHVLI